MVKDMHLHGILLRYTVIFAYTEMKILAQQVKYVANGYDAEKR